MNKGSFLKWLKAVKKLDDSTCKARTSNCIRIEKHYGDLDEIFERDKCQTILSELKYTKKDYDDSVPPKHRIPIDGNQYTGTHTLRSALNLYIEFKENRLLTDIMTMPDIIPDKHDGSYELVRETVSSLANTPLERIDIPDLDLLYFMAVGTWKGGEKYRLEKIQKSHLPLEEKERLVAVFNRVVNKAKKHEYQNTVGQWSVGMFGTGFYTFTSKSTREDAQKFISLCIEIGKLKEENEMLDLAEETLKDGIKGMQTAVVSIVLHCLRPEVFPIINNANIEAAVLLEGEGVVLYRPRELPHYIQNARSIKKFRDEKCRFRNYRALDVKFWSVVEMKGYDDEFAFNIPDDELDDSENIGITREQWIAMLNDSTIFNIKDIELVLDIYDIGGQATATELASKRNVHPSSFNFPVVALAKRVQSYTNCLVPRRPDGQEKWWNVLFTGNYKDGGHFNWILRTELKEAIKEMYDEITDRLNEQQFIIAENQGAETNYWWINANPKNWSFDSIEVGQSEDYYSMKDGKKRRTFKYFENVKEGDMVIAYETHPVKAIVAICHISKAHDGERIGIEKKEHLVSPIEYSRLKGIVELSNMEFFRNPQGTIFRLTKEEYDEITNLIREENPTLSVAPTVSYTKDDFLEEVFMEEDQYERICGLLKNKLNIILQGPPGVGKTFIAKRLAYSIMGERDDTRVEMIQFHQSYSYEDFIMGYRPEEEGFKLKYGIFYRFCKKAQNDPNREYYFIIDEINRGNLSKIFGEILMLIEADKRGKGYAVPLTYTEKRFHVPENIHIIGTMNTADRSLALLDYALRRRFSFIEMQTAFDNLNFRGYIENKNNDLANLIIDRISKLNAAIESDVSLGKGFCIGHSYFCTNKSTMIYEDYINILTYEIIPQLAEYWFDEPDKVREWTAKLLG